MQVKVYSTPTCPHCIKTKEYLASKGVSFENIDVSQDQSAVDEMVKLTGQMGVPVIIVENDVIVGFDQPKIDSLLGL